MKCNKFVSIILARGGSKGIKNKNLIKINNQPLIHWSISQSIKSKRISKTFVSSDNDKILKISKKSGAEIIKRPKKFATSKSSSESAWLHAVKYLKVKKINADYIVGIQPTSPIREFNDFDGAINLLETKKFDSLFTSTIINDYFIWKKIKNKLKANYNFKKRQPRQLIENQYLENGSFYIFNTEGFLKSKCRLFGKIGTFKMNKSKSFQIDDFEDLQIIKLLAKRYLK